MKKGASRRAFFYAGSLRLVKVDFFREHRTAADRLNTDDSGHFAGSWRAVEYRCRILDVGFPYPDRTDRPVNRVNAADEQDS